MKNSSSLNNGLCLVLFQSILKNIWDVVELLFPVESNQSKILNIIVPYMYHVMTWSLYVVGPIPISSHK